MCAEQNQNSELHRSAKREEIKECQIICLIVYVSMHIHLYPHNNHHLCARVGSSCPRASGFIHWNWLTCRLFGFFRIALIFSHLPNLCLFVNCHLHFLVPCSLSLSLSNPKSKRKEKLKIHSHLFTSCRPFHSFCGQFGYGICCVVFVVI